MCIIISCFTLVGSVIKMNEGGQKNRETVHITLISLCFFILQHIYSFGDMMIVVMRFVSGQPSPLPNLLLKKENNTTSWFSQIIRWWYKQYTKCLQRKSVDILIQHFYCIIITICCINAFYEITRKNLIPSKTLNLLSSSTSYCLRNKVITWIGLVPYHIIPSYHFRSVGLT